MADFRFGESNSWNEIVVKQCFPLDEAACILNIPWPIACCEDKLMWRGNKDGRFSVKNCCNINIDIPNANDPGLWGICGT